MAFYWISWRGRKGKRTRPHVYEPGSSESLCRSTIPAAGVQHEFKGGFETPFRSSLILEGCCQECLKAYYQVNNVDPVARP